MNREKAIKNFEKALDKLSSVKKELKKKDLNKLREAKSKIDAIINPIFLPIPILPGKSITNNNTEGIYYTPYPKHIESTHKLGFSNHRTNDLIPPIVQAFLINKDKLEIPIVILVDTSYGIKNSNFKFKYNVCINTVGDLQLNIYVYFHKKEPTNKTGDFNIYPFTIHCTNSLLVFEGLSESINKTVQVSLINTDPKTSRGTTTTVQTQNEV